MSSKILHVLSQRPSRTGSGVTLEALIRLASSNHWHQAAVVGVPSTDPTPRVGTLPLEAIFPVTFSPDQNKTEAADLPFPIPGMSDVMPYPSSVWSQLSAQQLASYRQVWKEHLARTIELFQPDIIHSNHLWLVTALLAEVAPEIPRLATCHATGLRQMHLCSHLKEEVVAGCRQLDHILALRQDHKEQLVKALGISPERVSVVGVGYREDIFRQKSGVHQEPQSILYVGKFSGAKGLPWLLEAFGELSREQSSAVLHIAGDGAGPEAETLRKQMKESHPRIIMHGQLDQPQLADLMRKCQVCVLPSFYEGVPLVLAEAAACGCRIVATALPGVCEQLAPHLKSVLDLVEMPPLNGPDTPDPAGLPAFVADLRSNLENALRISAEKGPDTLVSPDFSALTWSAVFQRVEKIWWDLKNCKS